jgi:hypothetical protein
MAKITRTARNDGVLGMFRAYPALTGPAVLAGFGLLAYLTHGWLW